MADEASTDDTNKTKNDDQTHPHESRSSGSGIEKRDDENRKEDDSSQDKPRKPKGPPLYKRPVFIVTSVIVTAIIVVGGIVLWLFLRQYVSTDDAFIDGHVVQISPQVAAQVASLHVVDNQLVHRGDLLIELDPTDYQVALQQAQAQKSEADGRLEQTRAQIEAARAAVPEAVAQQHSAEASLINASNDWQRLLRVDPRARSQQQLDNAGTALTNAMSRLEEAKAHVVSVNANVTTAEASTKAAEGEVKAADAGIHKAEVNLSYCRITAPSDGRVTERTVETGNYVAPGQALLLLVDPNVWITANFKETQLTHMRPGQPVRIKIDAFPDAKLDGHIDSIQAGSGSRFSVLPAENATGNYVKIVQRVPVKILFDHGPNTNDAALLSPGLSVTPRVKVR
jgi:membrane fusion protein (multidrug efflux system)